MIHAILVMRVWVVGLTITVVRRYSPCPNARHGRRSHRAAEGEYGLSSQSQDRAVIKEFVQHERRLLADRVVVRHVRHHLTGGDGQGGSRELVSEPPANPKCR